MGVLPKICVKRFDTRNRGHSPHGMPEKKPKLTLTSPPKSQSHCGVPWQWSNGVKEVWWYQDTWGFDFHFLECESVEQFVDWLRHTSRGYYEVDPGMRSRLEQASAAHVFCTGKYGAHAIIVFFRKWVGVPDDFNALVHEMTHLIFDVLSYKGVGTHPDAHEAFTYLSGSLTGDLLSIIGYKSHKATPWKWARTDANRPKHPSEKKP